MWERALKGATRWAHSGEKLLKHDWHSDACFFEIVRARECVKVLKDNTPCLKSASLHCNTALKTSPSITVHFPTPRRSSVLCLIAPESPDTHKPLP